MKKALLALVIASGFLVAFNFGGGELNTTSEAEDISKLEKCVFKGIPLHGKVKFVENFPDFTIQFVNNWGDIKVKFVEDFPEYCGEWQIDENYADFKVKVVENFADLKVEVVENNPGLNR